MRGACVGEYQAVGEDRVEEERLRHHERHFIPELGGARLVDMPRGPRVVLTRCESESWPSFVYSQRPGYWEVQL